MVLPHRFLLLYMFVTAYLNTAISILNDYEGAEPFHHFIKKYFAAHKKFGSRDRRFISELCYSYFRLGKSLPEVSVAEKLCVALLLCHSAHPVLLQLKPEWSAIAKESLPVKLTWVTANYPFAVADIFPFKETLSGHIDYASFCASFLIQPLLYLRIRPGKRKAVLKKLEVAALSFEMVSEACIALPNTSKVDSVLELDKEVVVQDVSSQEVINPLKEHPHQSWSTVWDCCAASGGKSILLKDHFPDVKLTVSDIRKSILVNLQERFKRAGIKDYTWLIADVASDTFSMKQCFDLIICDAPCSGSGTWSRTPEQLYFFDEKKIDYYTSLQKKIAINAARYLNKNGLFLYITCSVFEQENEAVVQYIQEQLSLKLQSMQYFKGYEAKADTLFVALFQL